jgi:hypothetical protein
MTATGVPHGRTATIGSEVIALVKRRTQDPRVVAYREVVDIDGNMLAGRDRDVGLEMGVDPDSVVVCILYRVGVVVLEVVVLVRNVVCVVG